MKKRMQVRGASTEAAANAKGVFEKAFYNREIGLGLIRDFICNDVELSKLLGLHGRGDRTFYTSPSARNEHNKHDLFH